MSLTRRTMTVALGVALSSLLVGCAGYRVDVRNLSTKPIFATVHRAHPLGDHQELDRQWVGPGERKQLGPLRRQPVWVYTLEVDAPDNPGVVARANLDTGRNTFNVTRLGPDDTGDVYLERID